MTSEPRLREDYSARQVEAARRALVDVWQVLGAYADCLVVVGGWTPDLLLPHPKEPHVGSIDVDLALDAAKLNDGRYADLLKLLLDTRRYSKGAKDFQFVTVVDLHDGGTPVQVEVEFLASKEVKLKKHKPQLLAGFRVLQADACAAAFHAPVEQTLEGRNVKGAMNTVRLRVASLADFLVMKAHAIHGRDKPKDAYDFCYCLDEHPDGIEVLAKDWQGRKGERDVAKALMILREKFSAVEAFGPQQVVEFYHASNPEERDMQARRAYELVQHFLALVG